MTPAEVLAFSTNADSMAIPAATYAKLKQEGITLPSDLIDFNKDSIDQIAKNLRNPGDRIEHPNAELAKQGQTIPRPPYVFGAKSQKRLLEACAIVRYYQTTGRRLTTDNLKYSIIKYFIEQWNAMKKKKEETAPEVPKISKQLPVLKWSEAFIDYLNRAMGARTIPLAYVVRTEPVVPSAPALVADRPYSSEHGSVEAELIARASHDHPLFQEDNSKLYFALEEATRSTTYSASLKPYQRLKNGKDAFAAILAQYAGPDKWEAELKRQDTFLHDRKWKGQGNFPLERFIAQHRNAFVSMTQCSQYVTYQLPNEYTRVGFLLENILCNDPGLQAAMAQVQSDKTSGTGKRYNFEATAAFLVQYDPVAKQRVAAVGKRGSDDAHVSDVTADISAASGFGSKVGLGKTGVHLRYHNKAEYKALSHEQRVELHEWRAEQRQKGVTFKGSLSATPSSKSSLSGNKRPGKTLRKSVASVVSGEMQKFLQKMEEQQENAQIDALVSSLDNAAPPPQKKIRITEPQTTVNSSALRSILRRVRNPGSATEE